MNKFSIEIKWAIILTIGSLIWNALEKAFGLHDDLISQHLLFNSFFPIIAIVIYVMALRDKNKNYYGGNMNWSQGFLSGAIMSVFITVLSPLVIFLTYEYISPEYFENAIGHATSKGATTEKSEIYFNLKSFMLQSAFSSMSLGVVISGVVALFNTNQNTNKNA